MRFRHLLIALVVSGVFAGTAGASTIKISISQVYGGGGNSGATYTHDFVELFNAGDVAVDLTGWSLQYASATGTGNFGGTSAQLTPLSGVIQPGQYFLIQEALGAGGTTPLPLPDITDASPIAMSATAGKVALISSSVSLGCNGGSTPCSLAQLALIVDLVGYGTGPTTGANFFEGSGAAPTLSNTTAGFRLNGGCTDTDDNAADFVTGAPAPRNSSSSLSPCLITTAVPEPATLMLLGAGLAAVAARRRTTTRAQAVNGRSGRSMTSV